MDQNGEQLGNLALPNDANVIHDRIVRYGKPPREPPREPPKRFVNCDVGYVTAPTWFANEKIPSFAFVDC